MASFSKQLMSQDPSDKIKAPFQDYPWAMKLFSDPTLQPFIDQSRIVKPTNNGDTFVARTLATEDTISAWQSFHTAPPPGAQYGGIITILKIGSGVNGHIDICHGGFVSLLLDEVIGTVADHVRSPDRTTMTAYLNVDYKKPVPTPNVDSEDGGEEDVWEGDRGGW
jgi:acyl-coenzyme A thioesterase THEM4